MHEIANEAIYSVIKTLKELDVRGYDSMNRLVGLVLMFESLLQEPVKENGEEKGEE